MKHFLEHQSCNCFRKWLNFSQDVFARRNYMFFPPLSTNHQFRLNQFQWNVIGCSFLAGFFKSWGWTKQTSSPMEQMNECCPSPSQATYWYFELLFNICIEPYCFHILHAVSQYQVRRKDYHFKCWYCRIKFKSMSHSFIDEK